MKRVALSLVLAAGLAILSDGRRHGNEGPAGTAAARRRRGMSPSQPALMNDYNLRGITQSAHKPSTQAGFELRYNFRVRRWQGYVGVSGESIDFPNRAAAEIDIYGGIRPTFDKLALDFGFWEYWYPGGQCFNANPLISCAGQGIGPTVNLPNGNVAKANASFYEVVRQGAPTL